MAGAAAIAPWLLAARPATLWAAIAPVLVGSALAARAEVFRLDAFVVVLLAALAIQVAVNFANDVADAARGADTDARVGPPRAVASGLISPRRMWIGIWVVLGFAALCGIYLIVIAGWVIAAIGILSIAAAFGYTNGPYPYGYRGLGEVFVFVFFGLVATVGTRYVYDMTAPTDAWLLAVPMGLLAAAILTANNVRDAETDAAAGKRTLAVIIGPERATKAYLVMVWAALVAPALAAAAGWVPRGAALALVAIPLALPLAAAIRSGATPAGLIAVLKGTARLQLALAVLIGLGILLT